MNTGFGTPKDCLFGRSRSSGEAIPTILTEVKRCEEGKR
jgi:hypothetical protein